VSEPCATTTAVRRRLTALVKRGLELGSELWQALQARDHAAIKSVQQRLESHQLDVCAKWRLRDSDGATIGRDESTAPYGETLAHAAAFAGETGLLQRLLTTSAKTDLVRRRGIASGFTALHCAVAGGHVEACRLLLDAGSKVSTTSASRRSALWTACIKGSREVALLLLERGADPHQAPQGSESAFDALRRIGGTAAKELRAEITARTAGESATSRGGAEKDDDDDEGDDDEGEGEGEEEEEEAEREARKTLAAAATSKLVSLPSVHPHQLEPCHRSHYCDVRGPGCCYNPTAYNCVECPAYDAPLPRPKRSVTLCVTPRHQPMILP
jgi:hypothetical protein